MAALEGIGPDRGHVGAPSWPKFYDLYLKSAPGLGGARKQALHRLSQPLACPERPRHHERFVAVGELTVKDQERKAAEVVPVQVRDEYYSSRPARDRTAARRVSAVAPQSSSTGAASPAC